MQALEFWKTVTMDKSNLLERVINLLNEHGIRYCVIGGVGVNAYAEPLVTLDLDLVVGTADIERADSLFSTAFSVKRFPHSLNLSMSGSQLRVQIQTDPRYAGFVARSKQRPVLGLLLPVASPQDLLQGKIWAAQDPARRRSKRRKDLLDIERLVEAQPELADELPHMIRDELDRLGG